MMAYTPPPRAPEAVEPRLTERTLDRIVPTYAAVYASCAGFGMAETACRRYARDAVKDLTAFVNDIRKEHEA